MLLTGRSEHAIDGKLRLAVPARYRNLWRQERDGDAWMCLPWPTGHLRLYTEGRFTQLAEQRGGSLTPDETEADVETTLFGLAERLEPDTAGRVSLPKRHLEMVGLPSEAPIEVVVVGAGTRLEVWGKERWTSEEQARFKRLPELIRQLESGKHGGDGGPRRAIP